MLPQATATAPGLQPEDFSGVELLDLSVADPISTGHLSFTQSKNAAFTEENDSWSVQPSGSMQFCLSLPDPMPTTLHGVALILQSCSGAPTEDSDSAIEVSVNDTKLVENYAPASDFSAFSWYIEETILQPGENTITVTASTGTTDLKSVSIMSFYTEMQFQSDWCWAAVSKNVSFFFDSASPWTQCKIVNKCFAATIGKTDCCQDGLSILCDRPGSLSQALTTVNNLESFISGSPMIDDIRTQISAGKPVGIMINWSGGGAHFITVTGVGPDQPAAADQTMVAVEDTLNGPSYITYATLIGSYRGAGTVSHYYWTENAN
jgi:hypothetical protein